MLQEHVLTPPPPPPNRTDIQCREHPPQTIPMQHYFIL